MIGRKALATAAAAAMAAALLLTACGTAQPQDSSEAEGSPSASSAAVQEEKASAPLAFVGMTEDGKYSVQYAEDEGTAHGSETAVMLVENIGEGGSAHFAGKLVKGDDGTVTVGNTDGQIRFTLSQPDDSGVILAEIDEYGTATVTASDPAAVNEAIQTALG